MNDMRYICCPNCGQEYLPGEIFIPSQFLGQPTEIEKTVEGKIDYYNGITQNLKEEFICEKCNKVLNITASITYDVKLDTLKDFSKNFTSSLYKNRITLDEVEENC